MALILPGIDREIRSSTTSRLWQQVAVPYRYTAIVCRAHVSVWRHEMGTVLQRRRFTADEYYRLAAVGILRENDRVELLDGDIVEMTPIGSHHAACVDRLIALLQRRVEGRGILRVQNPIRLNSRSEPQPDLSVLKLRTDFYASSHPQPGDILLV